MSRNEDETLKTREQDLPSSSSDKDITTSTFNIGKDILEYFENLNWNVVDGSEFKSCMTRFLPYKEDNSIQGHSLQLIYSQRFCYPEQAYDLSKLKNDEDKSIDYYVPGVSNSVSLYPTNSALTKKEQSLLYYFHAKNKFQNPPLQQQELIDYQKLLKKAQPEYLVFQQYVQSMWIKNQCHRSLEIPASVLEYIGKLWSVRAKTCLALYPPFYKATNYVPLMLNDPNNDHSVMEFDRMLLKRGGLPMMSLPSLKTRCDLITDFDKLCKIKSISKEGEEPSVKSITRTLVPASIDQNIDMNIKQYNIDVVITCSGIKNIVDVYNFQRDWILPVTVKNVLTVNGEMTKKVVIIDKCLPPSEMSVYEKNVLHAKLVSKWSLLQSYSPYLLDKEEPDNQSVQERKLTQYECDGIRTEVSEEFGVSVSSSGTSCKPQIRNKQADAVLDDKSKTGKEEVCGKLKTLSINSLEDDVEEGQIVEEDKPELMYARKRKSINDVPVSGLKSAMNENNLYRPKLVAKKNGLKNPCLAYNLWNLHKSTHFNMSKQEQRHLKILVRTKEDGHLINYKNSVRKMDRVYVSSKLEYQPEYGASTMTRSELIREYVDTFIRQTNLCRVRSVGHTKELMMFEVMNLAEIKDSLKRHYNMETHKLFDPLYAVLTKLIDLPVGHYMLQHSPRMGAFAQMLVESQENCNFNLSTYCEELKEKDINLPAAQIDSFTLTKIHFRDKNPPALFRPRPNLEKARFLSKKPFQSQLIKKRARKRNKKKKSLKILCNDQNMPNQ